MHEFKPHYIFMTSLYFYPLFLMHFNFSEEEHISYMQTAHGPHPTGFNPRTRDPGVMKFATYEQSDK